jgi:F-type H+-transporting ATPase subunit delta
MSDTAETASHVDVGTERVARVYAEALLSEAWDRHQGQETLEELEALVRDVLTPNPELEEYLSSEIVPRERKREVLEKALSGKAEDLLTKFLLVLNHHDRLGLIRPILAEYRDLYDKRQNRVRVEVSSAVPLTEAETNRIKDGIRSRLGKEPVVEATVDPELIGGVVVRVTDWLYDGSVRARLDAIRTHIIERGSHEIQSGRDRFSSEG